MRRLNLTPVCAAIMLLSSYGAPAFAQAVTDSPAPAPQAPAPQARDATADAAPAAPTAPTYKR